MAVVSEKRNPRLVNGRGDRSGTDVLTPEQRSRCMSRIRGRHTGPEVALRKALWHLGLRYRLNYPLPGKPDITFPGRKVVIFVDGCFWHRCTLHWVPPRSNAAFWEAKISRNVHRDAEINARLRAQGWTVIRIWEHEIRESFKRAAESVALSVRGTGYGTTAHKVSGPGPLPDLQR